MENAPAEKSQMSIKNSEVPYDDMLTWFLEQYEAAVHCVSYNGRQGG